MGLDFTNKVGVVTGASSGVGAATATMLAAQGARVVLVGRHQDRLAATAAVIKEGPGSSVTVVGDLCDDNAPEAVREAAVDAYGSVDIVVHCAGLLEKGTMSETSVGSIDRMWRINARAPMLLTKALIPHLNEGSAVVFVSSTGPTQGSPLTPPIRQPKEPWRPSAGLSPSSLLPGHGSMSWPRASSPRPCSPTSTPTHPRWSPGSSG